MNQVHEFLLSQSGFQQLAITASYGRFYEGQTVWGRYFKNDNGHSWAVRIVNEAGHVLGTIPARYTRRKRG